VHNTALSTQRLFDPSAEKKLQVKRRPIQNHRFQMQAYVFDSTAVNFSGFDLFNPPAKSLEAPPHHFA